METNNCSLEEIFGKLDLIVKELESPELSLEDSFERYKTGIDLVKKANSSIEKIEHELTVIEEDSL